MGRRVGPSEAEDVVAAGDVAEVAVQGYAVESWPYWAIGRGHWGLVVAGAVAVAAAVASLRRSTDAVQGVKIGNLEVAPQELTLVEEGRVALGYHLDAGLHLAWRSSGLLIA